MKIGIIVAMEKELRSLQSFFTDGNVVVQQSGIGKVNAALGAARMINEHHPDVIISSGCAGGASTELEVQDVVVSTELCYHDVYCGNAVGESVLGQVQGLPPRFAADPQLLATAKMLDCGINIVPGLIVTGDWFVDSREKMREIIANFPDAQAVDMESAAIAQTCHLMHVPFVSFRVISDIPLKDTKAAMYHDFWTRVAEESFAVTHEFTQAVMKNYKIK